jgi:DNA-binding CsgD family transcriptional regulator
MAPDDLLPLPLRVHLIEVIRRLVPFDHYAWLVTDPQTWEGSAPLATVPAPLLPRLPELIRLRYTTALNRWTALPPSGVALLHRTGEAASSPLWTELLRAEGVRDVASIVFADRFGCWGFLELWRLDGCFSDADAEALAQAVPGLTAQLRRSQATTFSLPVPPAPPGGPVVLLLSNDLAVRAQTARTAEYLRLLVPSPEGIPAIPAGAYNVAGQLQAIEQGVDDHPASARVHLADGQWVTLRAARADGDIAVTIEPTPPLDRADVFARTHGLGPRERQVLDQLIAGADTRLVARRLSLSEHTVQDHVKALFAKTGTQARPQLVSRAIGT